MSVHRPFRCLVGMAVHAEDPANDETDKTLWILARFTFLFAELGILALSVCIGRLSDPFSSDGSGSSILGGIPIRIRGFDDQKLEKNYS
jgi:hypothetical protein